MSEAARAALDLPLALARTETGLALVLVCSLQTDRNALLAPNGMWLAGYVPLVVGVHPFILDPAQEAGNYTVFVDTASDWLSTTDGQPLFNADGEPGPVLEQKIQALQQLPDTDRDMPVLNVLEELKLLIPWEGLLDGSLLRVDQEAFYHLDGDAMVKLRNSQALTVAFAQLFSLQRVENLHKIAGHQTRLAEQQALQLQSMPAMVVDEIEDMIRFE